MNYTYKIEAKPDYSFLSVTIPANQKLNVEASAMATMDSHVEMKTRMKGGLSRLLGGESIFINEFSAKHAAGEICIAPGPPGDMDHVHLENQSLYLQSSSYVASTPGIEIQSKWQGLVKGFFSGESLFLIKCSGTGDLWFNTYGGMFDLDVDGEMVVDTGHIVAFTEGLDYSISRLGGYKSLFFSGEGFVCRFQGQGKIWIQTRELPALASWIWPFRRVQRRNNGD